MNKKRNKKFKYIIVTGFALFIIFSIIFNSKYITNYTIIPMQKGINFFGTILSEKGDYLLSLKEVRSENEYLEQLISKLKFENQYLQQEKYELNRLKKLHELDKKYPEYDKIGAYIIGLDDGSESNFLYNVFTINKGSNDGLEEGMNVLAEGGLVGIITETNKYTSKVRAIIDDNSNVTAVISSSASDTIDCIIYGGINLMNKSNLLYFETLADNNDLNIKVGDQIITSDISSKYLEGLLIGYVSDVSLNSDHLTITGEMIPSVDFNHITEVLVIKKLK